MSTKIRNGCTVQRSRNIVFSRLDAELLAIDGQGGYCYSLNNSAGRIWELIEAPVSVQELCRRLRSEYDVDEASCERDVVELLERLSDAGLVAIGDAT
jgi:arylamine N-acetyltransferase